MADPLVILQVIAAKYDNNGEDRQLRPVRSVPWRTSGSHEKNLHQQQQQQQSNTSGGLQPMSVSSGSDVTIPIQDSPPPPPSPYANGSKSIPSSIDQGDTSVNSSHVTVTNINGTDNKAFQHSPEKTEDLKKNHTEIDMISKENETSLNNETLNSELVNSSIMNTIPAKPQPHVGPFENFDENYVSVNQHKKFLGRSEKLYVTKDKRRTKNCKKYLIWLICLSVVAALITCAVLVGVGLIPMDNSEKTSTESSFGTTSSQQGSTTLRPETGIFGSSSTTTEPLTEVSLENDVWGTVGWSSTLKPNKSHSDPNFELSSITSTTYSTPNSAPGVSTVSPPNFASSYVPKAATVELMIENKEFDSLLNNQESIEFKELASDTENRFKRKLEEDFNVSQVNAKVAEFKHGSVIVIMKISWKDEFKSRDDIAKILPFVTQLGQYRISSPKIYGIIDMCSMGNMKCSHDCEFNAEKLDFLCTCPETLFLQQDMKTCTASRPSFLSSTTEEVGGSEQTDGESFTEENHIIFSSTTAPSATLGTDGHSSSVTLPPTLTSAETIISSSSTTQPETTDVTNGSTIIPPVISSHPTHPSSTGGGVSEQSVSYSSPASGNYEALGTSEATTQSEAITNISQETHHPVTSTSDHTQPPETSVGTSDQTQPSTSTTGISNETLQPISPSSVADKIPTWIGSTTESDETDLPLTSSIISNETTASAKSGSSQEPTTEHVSSTTSGTNQNVGIVSQSTVASSTASELLAATTIQPPSTQSHSGPSSENVFTSSEGKETSPEGSTISATTTSEKDYLTEKPLPEKNESFVSLGSTEKIPDSTENSSVSLETEVQPISHVTDITELLGDTRPSTDHFSSSKSTETMIATTTPDSEESSEETTTSSEIFTTINDLLAHSSPLGTSEHNSEAENVSGRTEMSSSITPVSSDSAVSGETAVSSQSQQGNESNDKEETTVMSDISNQYETSGGNEETPSYEKSSTTKRSSIESSSAESETQQGETVMSTITPLYILGLPISRGPKKLHLEEEIDNNAEENVSNDEKNGMSDDINIMNKSVADSNNLDKSNSRNDTEIVSITNPTNESNQVTTKPPPLPSHRPTELVPITTTETSPTNERKSEAGEARVGDDDSNEDYVYQSTSKEYMEYSDHDLLQRINETKHLEYVNLDGSRVDIEAKTTSPDSDEQIEQTTISLHNDTLINDLPEATRHPLDEESLVEFDTFNESKEIKEEKEREKVEHVTGRIEHGILNEEDAQELSHNRDHRDTTERGDTSGEENVTSSSSREELLVHSKEVFDKKKTNDDSIRPEKSFDLPDLGENELKK